MLLFRLCGYKSPPLGGGFDVLGPLFGVNPFKLDQYIDVWTHGVGDSVQTFVVEVTSLFWEAC